jgi:thiol:disulfide interchange protein DsbC
MSRTIAALTPTTFLLLSAVASLAVNAYADNDPCAGAAEKFTAELAKAGQNEFKVDAVKQSQVKGLCEIQTGANILYFAPTENLIITGNIFDFKGRNYTKEKMEALTNELLGKTLSRLPLDKAISVGKGPVQVIEITDPDCPYCRKASAWLDGRSDVTRKIFFAPMAHPKAIEKVKVILAAKDQEAEYHAYMRGEHDKDTVVPTVTDEKAKALADEHLKLATEAKVNGTPTFFVNGTVVIGADTEGLKRAIEKGNKKSL